MTNASELLIGKLSDIYAQFILLLPNFGIALVVVVLFWFGALLAQRAIRGVFHHQRRTDLGNLLGGFARWGITGLGFLVVATIIFPSVKPSDALATLGIGSVAIGFAFKDILQNWFAGLLILIRQPFRTGDQIVVSGFEGTVEHIEARATLIKTYDGRRVVIPNSDVYTRAVTVNTAFPKRRSDYDVGIGYGDDIETARRVVLEALGKLPGVESEPAPDAIPWELDGSSVNIKVRWWTDARRSNVVAARGDVIAALKKALGNAGIDLPYPTRVVLFHDQTEAVDGNRRDQREGWPPNRESHAAPARVGQDAEERDDSPTPFRQRPRRGQRNDAS
jgi:small conductance mechanosensitive channel